MSLPNCVNVKKTSVRHAKNVKRDWRISSSDLTNFAQIATKWTCFLIANWNGEHIFIILHHLLWFKTKINTNTYLITYYILSESFTCVRSIHPWLPKYFVKKKCSENTNKLITIALLFKRLSPGQNGIWVKFVASSFSFNMYIHHNFFCNPSICREVCS